jgi:hypothetical protein
MKHIITIAAVALAVAASTAGCGSNAGSSSSTKASAAKLTHKQMGIVGYGDDNALYANFPDGNTYVHPEAVVTGFATCGWSGDHLIVTVKFRNHMAGSSHPTAYWYPYYQIANDSPSIVDDSVHGDSGDAQKTTLKLGKFTVITVDAGSPDGVDAGTAISNCNPRIMDVAPIAG